MVSAEVAGIMGNSEYYGEGAAASGDGRGCVGRSVEKWHSEIRCDNAAVVAILRLGISRCPKAMRLIRCLFVFASKFNVVLVAEHVPGVESSAADALSRDNLPSFFPLVQGASQSPSVVPRQLVQALVEHPAEWTSKTGGGC